MAAVTLVLSLVQPIYLGIGFVSAGSVRIAERELAAVGLECENSVCQKQRFPGLLILGITADSEAGKTKQVFVPVVCMQTDPDKPKFTVSRKPLLNDTNPVFCQVIRDRKTRV